MNIALKPGGGGIGEKKLILLEEKRLCERCLMCNFLN